MPWVCGQCTYENGDKPECEMCSSRAPPSMASAPLVKITAAAASAPPQDPTPIASSTAVKTTNKRSFKWYWLGGYWADANGRRTSDPGQSAFPQTAWQEYDVRTSALLSGEFNRWNVHPDAPVKDTRLLLDLAPQPCV